MRFSSIVDEKSWHDDLIIVKVLSMYLDLYVAESNDAVGKPHNPHKSDDRREMKYPMQRGSRKIRVAT